jgi:hypothetical protein
LPYARTSHLQKIPTYRHKSQTTTLDFISLNFLIKLPYSSLHPQFFVDFFEGFPDVGWLDHWFSDQ